MSWRDKATKVDDWRAKATKVEPEVKEAGVGAEEQARGFLSGLASSATLGYAPKLYGKTQQAIGEIGELFGGEDIPSQQRYEQAVKEYQDYEAGTKKDAPISQTVGEVAGYLAPGKAVGLAGKGLMRAIPTAQKAMQAAPAISKVGAGATEAAVLAGAQEQDGTVKERINNAGKAALMGGGINALSGVVGKVSQKAYDLARNQRIKGAGAMLKDFRNLFNKDRINQIDDFIKEEKLVSPFSTVESVAKKAETIKQQTGLKLRSLYNQAKEKLAQSTDNLTIQQAFQKAGFQPKVNKAEILAYIDDGLKGEANKTSTVRSIGRYLDEIAKDFGDDLDIVDAREIKSAIDRQINYARIGKEPIKEKAMRRLRDFVSKRIDDQIEFLDDNFGGEGLGALKSLNKKYGNAATVADMATDKFNRELSNNVFGFGEQVVGLAPGAYYAGERAMAGDIEGAVKGVGFGLLGAGAMKARRTYGSGIAAPLSQGAGAITKGAQGLLRRGAPIAPAYLQRDK